MHTNLEKIAQLLNEISKDKDAPCIISMHDNELSVIFIGGDQSQGEDDFVERIIEKDGVYRTVSF